MSYDNVYWSKQKMDEVPTTADILAIGDSWFWYFLPGGSLVTQIGELVGPTGHNIFVVGNNGAEAYDYVKGKYKRQVSELLRLYGSAASALLISGGGNDFAGFNDLRPLLNKNCETAKQAAECFIPGDDEPCIGWLMQRVYENYAILISRALFVLPGSAKIFLHTYAYAIPSGKGAFGGKHAWLKPALNDAKVPDELQQKCVEFVIDRLHNVLDQLARASAGRVVVVDTRKILSPDDWANELHPNGQGFRKIAELGWLPKLQEAGLA